MMTVTETLLSNEIKYKVSSIMPDGLKKKSFLLLSQPRGDTAKADKQEAMCTTNKHSETSQRQHTASFSISNQNVNSFQVFIDAVKFTFITHSLPIHIRF